MIHFFTSFCYLNVNCSYLIRFKSIPYKGTKNSRWVVFKGFELICVCSLFQIWKSYESFRWYTNRERYSRIYILWKNITLQLYNVWRPLLKVFGLCDYLGKAISLLLLFLIGSFGDIFLYNKLSRYLPCIEK